MMWFIPLIRLTYSHSFARSLAELFDLVLCVYATIFEFAASLRSNYIRFHLLVLFLKRIREDIKNIYSFFPLVRVTKCTDAGKDVRLDNRSPCHQFNGVRWCSISTTTTTTQKTRLFIQQHQFQSWGSVWWFILFFFFFFSKKQFIVLEGGKISNRRYKEIS